VLFQLTKFRNRRFKELQLLIKGPGEMFGHEEILEKLTERRCSCTCISPTAELLVISEKDFQKRILNPETFKYIQDSHSVKSGWEKQRVDKLMKIEEYKNSVTFTPLDLLKPKTQRSASPTIHEANIFNDLPHPRTCTASLEAQQLHFHKEMLRFKRRSNTKHNESFTETRSASKQYSFGDLYIVPPISRSMTPGPNNLIQESRSIKYESFFPLFKTEITPEEPQAISKLNKAHKSPISIFSRSREVSMKSHSISRESPIMFGHSYTPRKLKPSRTLRKKFV
jgi:hypothetical protein